jgi:hypothetical protein
MPHDAFPDLATLSARLSAILGGEAPPRGSVTVLEREPSPYASTFPIEVVTCRMSGGSLLRLFCKYAAGRDHNAHGHRGGVAYEADVYRRVLEPRGAATPRFYGSFAAGPDGHDCLIVEYIDHCSWVGDATDSGAMGSAARWIGAFHAANEGRGLGAAPPLLNVYDAEYYRGWSRRTLQFAGCHEPSTWLELLCERFEEALEPLLGPPPTIIHGEYYPENVLYRNGAVYPVDWESAAVAAGAIDLATLTDGWPAEVVGQCESEYRRARWAGEAPAGFDRTLLTARLYLLFRWLGDRPDWTAGAEPEAFSQLRRCGEELDLI